MGSYWKTRKAKNHAKHTLFHARHVRNMREDLLSQSDIRKLSDAEQALMTEIAGRNPEKIINSADKLAEICSSLAPDLRSSFRENFEIIVVAVAVAMAFRAFFFQPFKIPTGSMQPTLYGVHSSKAYEKPGIMDILPLKVFKWAITGDWYREVVIRQDGHVGPPVDGGMRYPSDKIFNIAGHKYLVPKDAVLKPELAWGSYLKKGDVLWSGIVTSGDHVFVNKFKWYFRSPKRGDVMVFQTTGINDLPPGIYYIKRMVGLPGESISIEAPDLCINGKPVREPESIARIAKCEGSYKGYQPAWSDPSAFLKSAADTYKLNEKEYFALGDNTINSRDGRYWGSVPEANLVGCGSTVYWPFSARWGLID